MTYCDTRSKARKSLREVDYVELPEFSSGILATKKEVIQNMLYLLRPKRAGQAQRSKDDAANILAELLQEHWLFCNLYTISTKSIRKHILKLYEDFTNLVQTRKLRQNANYQSKADLFNAEACKLFDIFCEDIVQRKKLERLHGVKMLELEWKFLDDQRNARQMLCDDFVDQKWMKTLERRQSDMARIERMREMIEEEKETSQKLADVGSEQSTSEETDNLDSDQTYTIPEGDDDNDLAPTKPKKARLLCSATITQDADSLPKEYQHIRLSVRKVRPEFYETVDKLKCNYHMSAAQAAAAVIEVGNKMFGRTWKYHGESEVIDLDTLPEASNMRQVGKSIEAMALAAIVDEIMNTDEQVTVTYSEDGSKKQGAGSFSVQGISINRMYRALPTMSIATESRRNLADLKVAVLKILEAASGVDAKTLFDKIDFVITDQTAHNFGIETLVATDLQSDHLPEHLFCNVHPSLMFNRVLTKQWIAIETTIGRDKIYSNFLVNASTAASSVTEQALDCMTRLISHDFDHKPWNKAGEFDIHIAPKSNKCVTLKDERFNRLTLTCAISLYHMNDLASFLQKYENVTNQLACIVRCFLDLDFLKVMYCSGALIGLHLIEPFLSLTMSSATRYSKLIPAFKELHHDLTHADPAMLLNLDEPAFQFVSKERFLQTRYDDDICAELAIVIELYQVQLIKLLQMTLPSLAAGFEKQKGDIFGFGDYNEECSHSLSSMDVQKLDQAPVHNLDAERSVGFVNYELCRRGAKQLGCASSSQVKAKASDLIEQFPSGSFQKFVKVVKKGGKIPEIMLAWNSKQDELRKKGLQDKEISNVAVDRRRNKDLETLKSMGGPFTSSTQVDQYLQNPDLEELVKVGRMFLEVRYARDTSLSLPKTSDIFRLMKEHKRLPSTIYGINIKVYLDNIVSKADVTLADFDQAINLLLC